MKRGGTRAAALEVAQKSDRQIERETALKWADRAVACYHRCAAATTARERERWLLRAESYRHEALEHAALAGGGLVARVGHALSVAARAHRAHRRHRR